ncbi:Xaa-Pro aminopeptidase [Actinokineospora spheciospongiae]|uniref:Xaa-Pro aminopeptidase n=1 Tax=Actinokineospora spheciospongiae TaxID=909613 RepID=W7IP00_9PSEU|nr:aminopeptidase P family protein [Actinokineospora spheciospongiae]EWC62103.1 Xaa-Pro aminopeptidase [Actinokineospora spheciospongiae]PWW62173.1 Xaa-Pro aminopeptidase [Actinokineospora spheciospongiae]
MIDRPARRDPSKLVQAQGFRDFVRDDWGQADRRVTTVPGAAEAAAAHRARLSAAFPGARIAVASGHAPVRANDSDYTFRPDSDFAWLTGCHAEGAVLVMVPHEGGHDAVLHLREPAGPGEADFFASSRDGELWIGAVPRLADWAEALGIACRPLEELPRSLRGQLPGVLAAKGVDPFLDAQVGEHSAHLRTVLSELRRVKDDWEINQLREAVDATVLGFADVARELPTAVRRGGERWLQGTFDRRARTEGNGPGYTSIVAAGPHAPILHWTRCDGPVPEDGLLLLDAGVEVNTLYTADVTRTFPVSGEFSRPQRQVYDLVHEAHLAAIAEVRPGNDYSAFHTAAMRVLAEGLHDWGLLPASVDKSLEADGQHHRRYICCGIGHLLGLDVHDCANARESAYNEGRLEVGMALTVEPGLYFHPNDLTVPPELRGIGVRIEDDLVVTPGGAEVLSAALPTTPDALTEWTRSHQG